MLILVLIGLATYLFLRDRLKVITDPNKGLFTKCLKPTYLRTIVIFAIVAPLLLYPDYVYYLQYYSGYLSFLLRPLFYFEMQLTVINMSILYVMWTFGFQYYDYHNLIAEQPILFVLILIFDALVIHLIISMVVYVFKLIKKCLIVISTNKFDRLDEFLMFQTKKHLIEVLCEM